MINRNEIRLLAEEIERIKSDSNKNFDGGYKADYVAKSTVKELLKEIKKLDDENYRVVHPNEDTGVGRKVLPLPAGRLVRKS